MTVSVKNKLVIVNGVLALAALVFAVLLVLTWLRQPIELEPVSVPTNSSMEPVQPLYWTWFESNNNGAQHSGQQTVQMEQAAEEYDEININAELLGVVLSPSSSSATISVGRRTEQVFHVGEEIEPGVEVTRIEPLRVVVTQRGRTLQLSFPNLSQAVRAVSGQNNNQRANTGPRETGQPGFELADMFSAVPVEVVGHSGGLKLGSITQDMKDLVDIRDDDVVVQVGDNSIQDLLSNPSSWVSLSARTSLPVTVIRDGQEKVIYVNALSLSTRLIPDLERD